LLGESRRDLLSISRGTQKEQEKRSRCGASDH